jgi:hypothetical protein
MRFLLLFVAGCGVASWDGAVPPIVPRHDPCGTGEPTAEGRQVIDRSPYLQNAHRDAVTVAWASRSVMPMQLVVSRADDSDRDPIARVTGGRVGPDRDAASAQRFAPYDDSDVGGEPGAPVAEDRRDVVAARIAGLPADDDGYCYRIERAGRPLTAWASLTLAPRGSGDRVDRFVILGDTGNGQPAQRALASRLETVPMDAIVFLGDLAYKAGTDEELQTRFFDVYPDLFARVPVYAVIGNHDNRTDHGRPFEEAFL